MCLAVNMAALRSLMRRLLDRVGRCFLGSVGAKSCTQWFEKDGGCVHLVNESRLEVGVVGRAERGVAANKVSVFDESVASMSVVMTHCHAVQGAAA